MLRALTHSSFRVIWACFVIGQGGFWLSQVTVQVLVVGLSGGDPFRQGLLVVIFFAPQLVVSPIAGVLADRYDRVRIMALAEAGFAVFASILAVVTVTGHVTIATLYLLSAALGIASAVIGPTGLALVGQSVPRRDISSAVALQSVAQNLARMAGPAIAVPVVFLGGPPLAFAGFAALASLTVGLLWRLKLPARAPQRRLSFFANLAEGLVQARDQPPTLLLLSMVLVAGLLAGPFVNVLGPVLAVSVLHEGGNGYFILVVASGAGAALGAIATGFQLRPPGPMQIAGELLLLGLSLLAVAAVSTYATLVVFTAVYGAIFFALMAGIATAIQHSVAEEHRGRVISLYALAWGGAIPPGALLMGYLAHALGTRAALLIIGALVAGYALVVVGAIAGGRREPRPVHRSEAQADPGQA